MTCEATTRVERAATTTRRRADLIVYKVYSDSLSERNKSAISEPVRVTDMFILILFSQCLPCLSPPSRPPLQDTANKSHSLPPSWSPAFPFPHSFLFIFFLSSALLGNNDQH